MPYQRVICIPCSRLGNFKSDKIFHLHLCWPSLLHSRFQCSKNGCVASLMLAISWINIFIFCYQESTQFSKVTSSPGTPSLTTSCYVIENALMWKCSVPRIIRFLFYRRQQPVHRPSNSLFKITVDCVYEKKTSGGFLSASLSLPFSF